MNKNIRTLITVTLQIEALHNWPDARIHIPEMGFLADLHRHIFHLKVKKAVTHDDRDIEIIQFKRSITKYLRDKYYKGDINICNFGARSCEMLAKEILEQFDCQYVECLEDNENGAEVYTV